MSNVSRVVTHDIPVDIIPRRLWNDFKEPSMPDFDVRGLPPVALCEHPHLTFCSSLQIGLALVEVQILVTISVWGREFQFMTNIERCDLPNLKELWQPRKV